jgi:hypothetical protein
MLADFQSDPVVRFYPAENVQFHRIEPPLCSGVLPFAFDVSYEMQQWSPRLYRYTTLGESEPGELAFDFDAVDPDQLASPKYCAILGRQIAAADPHCMARLQFSNHNVVICGTESLDDNANPSANRETALFDFALHVLNRQHDGLLKIVSHTSPSGSQYPEDLAILDSTDPTQCLLSVMQHTADEVIVYRRLYFTKPRGGPTAVTRSARSGQSEVIPNPAPLSEASDGVR